MIHGVELAQWLVKRIGPASGEQALVLQLPPLRTRSPSTPFAIATVRGTAWHVIAAVDTWSIAVAPPMALVRFAREFRWHDDDQPLDEMAAALAELARAWWAEAPDAVGALDVAGAITHAATAALGTAHGPIGNIVTSDPGRHGAVMSTRILVGRENPTPRWPYVADVYPAETGMFVRITGVGTTHVTHTIADVATLARLLPEIVETVRVTDDACHAWAVRSMALNAEVATWTARVLPPIAGTTWTTSHGLELQLDRSPGATVSAPARVGGTVDGYVTATDAGPRIRIGEATLTLAATDDDAARGALAHESGIVRVGRLVEGARYRVKQAFGSAAPGTVVTFQRVTEVRPSGTDVWFFADADDRTIALSPDREHEVDVLDHLPDYLEAI